MKFMCTEMVNGLLMGKAYRRASEWAAYEYVFMHMDRDGVRFVDRYIRRSVNREDMTMEWEDVEE